jgi:hypothetical protein
MAFCCDFSISSTLHNGDEDRQNDRRLKEKKAVELQ